MPHPPPPQFGALARIVGAGGMASLDALVLKQCVAPLQRVHAVLSANEAALASVDAATADCWTKDVSASVGALIGLLPQSLLPTAERAVPSAFLQVSAFVGALADLDSLLQACKRAGVALVARSLMHEGVRMLKKEVSGRSACLLPSHGLPRPFQSLPRPFHGLPRRPRPSTKLSAPCRALAPRCSRVQVLPSFVSSFVAGLGEQQLSDGTPAGKALPQVTTLAHSLSPSTAPSLYSPLPPHSFHSLPLSTASLFPQPPSLHSPLLPPPVAPYRAHVCR